MGRDHCVAGGRNRPRAGARAGRGVRAMVIEIAEARAVAGEGSPRGRQAAESDVPTRLWLRTFPGVPEQVREARHWIDELLPGCDPRETLVLIASEFCTNAVEHTGSGGPGGEFAVHLAWSPGSVRVTVGDQGSPESPRVVDAAAGEEEDGRGLHMVDLLAGRWGFDGGTRCRWVWADVPWLSGGGPPRIDSRGALSAVEAARGLWRSCPGIRVGYGGEPAMWWALLPGDSYSDDRLFAPCFGALSQVTAAAWAARGPGRSSGTPAAMNLGSSSS